MNKIILLAIIYFYSGEIIINRKAECKEEYHDLYKLSYLNQTEQTSNVVIKTDKKLLATQHLYEAPHRLKNPASN